MLPCGAAVKISFGACIMILGFLLFCLALPASPLQSFDLLGSIRDNTGKPVSSIRISLTDESYQPIRTVFTDTSGRFNFNGLISGRYYLKVEPAGMPFEEQTVSLDLQALRVRGGSEPYPVDIIIKRKKDASAVPERSGTVFAQTVPDAAKSEYEHGLNSIKDNKSDQAIETLKKAVALFPDYYLALELLGTEYVKRGEFDPAVPVLTHALEVNHTAPKSMYALGVAHLKLHRPAEALRWLKSAAEIDADNANVFMYLGLAYGGNGEFGESETAFKKAYQLGGDQVAEVHLYLASIYDKQQRYSEAARELEIYLKEAKGLKDQTKIKDLISKLKEKAKAKK
jgi:Flp pilus assembly protein TadD